MPHVLRTNDERTMTNQVVLTDDLRAVHRWENEGGQISLESLWASLKDSTHGDYSGERQMVDAHKTRSISPPVFSRFELGRRV